eukprot:364953-Chlamydomonas_euryale.AAC.1
MLALSLASWLGSDWERPACCWGRRDWRTPACSWAEATWAGISQNRSSAPFLLVGPTKTGDVTAGNPLRGHSC